MASLVAVVSKLMRLKSSICVDKIPSLVMKLNDEYMEKTKHFQDAMHDRKPDAVKYLEVLAFVCSHWINTLIFILKKMVLDSVWLAHWMTMGTRQVCSHSVIEIDDAFSTCKASQLIAVTWRVLGSKSWWCTLSLPTRILGAKASRATSKSYCFCQHPSV